MSLSQHCFEIVHVMSAVQRHVYKLYSRLNVFMTSHFETDGIFRNHVRVKRVKGQGYSDFEWLNLQVKLNNQTIFILMRTDLFTEVVCMLSLTIEQTIIMSSGQMKRF